MTFDEWKKQLKSEEIDLDDKLSNMCENCLSEELINLIYRNEKKYFSRIEQYIKEHINNYCSFIISETQKLYELDLIESSSDWSSGLYNCDEIYVRAISNALGFMWLIN